MKRAALLFVMAIALTGCGNGATHTVTVTTTTPAPHGTQVQVYFLYHGKVQPASRSVPTTAPAWLGAWKNLAAGPTGETPLGVSTALRVEGGWTLGVTSDNLLSLSTVAQSRAGLAQIVYTLSQFAPAHQVVVNGRRYRRSDFEDLTPAILVEIPLPEQRVTRPLLASGTANTFEATFEYELVDSAGRVLGKHFVTATSGSGTRGAFEFAVPYPAGHGGEGKLVVYESSAKDGSRIHEIAIPVRLSDN